MIARSATLGEPVDDPRLGWRVVAPPAVAGARVDAVLALPDGRCVFVLDRAVPGVGQAAVLEGQVELAPPVGAGGEA